MSMGGGQIGHPPLAQPSAPPSSGGGLTQDEPAAAAMGTQWPKSPTRNRCFNCGEVGHFRSNCHEPEHFLFCGDPAHHVLDCTARSPYRERSTLELLGHGIDLGFYYIDLGGGGVVGTPEPGGDPCAAGAGPDTDCGGHSGHYSHGVAVCGC